MRRLYKSDHAVVDLGVVLMIGIAFAALMVMAYIIFKVRDSLLPSGSGGWAGHTTNALNESYNNTWRSMTNVTGGFDNAVNLILVAITIFILAVAISALLMLRGGK